MEMFDQSKGFGVPEGAFTWFKKPENDKLSDINPATNVGQAILNNTDIVSVDRWIRVSASGGKVSGSINLTPSFVGVGTYEITSSVALAPEVDGVPQYGIVVASGLMSEPSPAVKAYVDADWVDTDDFYNGSSTTNVVQYSPDNARLYVMGGDTKNLWQHNPADFFGTPVQVNPTQATVAGRPAGILDREGDYYWLSNDQTGSQNVKCIRTSDNAVLDFGLQTYNNQKFEPVAAATIGGTYYLIGWADASLSVWSPTIGTPANGLGTRTAVSPAWGNLGGACLQGLWLNDYVWISSEWTSSADWGLMALDPVTATYGLHNHRTQSDVVTRYPGVAPNIGHPPYYDSGRNRFLYMNASNNGDLLYGYSTSSPLVDDSGTWEFIKKFDTTFNTNSAGYYYPGQDIWFHCYANDAAGEWRVERYHLGQDEVLESKYIRTETGNVMTNLIISAHIVYYDGTYGYLIARDGTNQAFLVRFNYNGATLTGYQSAIGTPGLFASYAIVDSTTFRVYVYDAENHQLQNGEFTAVVKR